MTTPATKAPYDKADIASKIRTPQLLDYKIKMIIYGDPGVGKTTLAATAGNTELMADVLFINVEGGILSVLEEGTAGIEKVPQVYECRRWPDLEGAFWFLANEDHQFKTVVVDSLSELAKVNLDQIVQSMLGKPTQSGKRRDDVDDPFLEDYGKNTQQMRRVIRMFRDLPMHVIFTCHAATNKSEDQVFPALTPKLRESVVGFMDVVAFMFTQAIPGENGEKPTIHRKLLTQPHGKWVAKDRSPGGKIGAVITNPDMPTIIGNIVGKKD